MAFANDATRVLKQACVEAHVSGAPCVAPVHVLIGICKFGSDAALEGLIKQSIDPVPFRRRVRMIAAQLAASAGRAARPAKVLDFSRETGVLLLEAERAASKSNREADSADLLIALMRNPDDLLAIVIREEKLNVDALASSLGRGRPNDADSPLKSSPTPMLDRFGTDLTQKARDGKLPPLVGRRKELLLVARILFRHEKNNAVLIGDPGVGKTRIVEGLAQYGRLETAPDELKRLRIVAIQPGALVAGTKYRGDLEERLSALVKEAAGDPNIVLFFDEMHALFSSESETASMVANLLKPPLARGELRCIGATTSEEFKRHIAKDAALARRFEEVRIDEPSPEEAREVLQGLRDGIAAHHGVSIDERAIEAALELSVRYLPERRLPDKARDLLDRAAVSKRIITLSRWQSAERLPEVGPEDVAAAVAELTGLPVTQLTEGDRSRLQRMEEALRERVIGQDGAVASVVRVVKTGLAGLGQPDRPHCVMMFVGPSGVGKTELARALARFLFLDESRLFRFDMSEYMDEHSASKLIGAPASFVGYHDGGKLTNLVQRTPYCVLLFDEVEKAHPRIFDLFLQVFDSGRLTDGQGRTTDFRNTLIIMTSNLQRTARKRAPVGFQAGDVAEGAEQESDRRDFLRAHFRTEFINRLSDVIEFRPLEKADLRRIIDKLVRDAAPRLAARGISLTLTDRAYDALIRHGYDPRFGAREIGRAFEQRIVQELASRWLEGHIESGCVEVDADEHYRIVLSRGVANDTAQAPAARSND